MQQSTERYSFGTIDGINKCLNFYRMNKEGPWGATRFELHNEVQKAAKFVTDKFLLYTHF